MKWLDDARPRRKLRPWVETTLAVMGLALILAIVILGGWPRSRSRATSPQLETPAVREAKTATLLGRIEK